ncbi:hypothetical protein THIOSC15_2090004 [uncultured Thiomicrorhabdus sp.]
MQQAGLDYKAIVEALGLKAKTKEVHAKTKSKPAQEESA